MDKGLDKRRGIPYTGFIRGRGPTPPARERHYMDITKVVTKLRKAQRDGRTVTIAMVSGKTHTGKVVYVHKGSVMLAPEGKGLDYIYALNEYIIGLY